MKTSREITAPTKLFVVFARRLCGPRALASLAFGLAAVLGIQSAALAQTVTFTEANINSLSSVLDAAPDLLRDDTGADVQRGPITGSRNALFFVSPCCANSVIKTVTDAAFARASLQTGTLKTKALLQLGSNTSVSGTGVPLGVRNGAASGTASFADSFRTFSGNRPFLWASGATATFHFGVTGQVTATGTVPNPATSAPPKPIDQIFALLTVNIYKPGTIDLLRQLKDFDFTRPFSEFLALANQIQANLITHDFWYFGQVIADFSVAPSKILSIDPSTPTDVQFTFTPGGDFDWVATLDTTTFLDASLQNVSATLDFSNSLVSSYNGPPGTTTFSGSGLFPSTLPSSQIPPPNVCPAGQGFWKNHPEAWPVSSLVLGNQTYTKAELLQILGAPGGGDASAILAAQLIAAKLSIASYSNPAPISATIAAADQLLSAFSGKLPYNVKPGSTVGQSMTQRSATLDSYNSDQLTPTCTP